MQGNNRTDALIGLADIFLADAIIIGLKNGTKRGVIEELVYHLVQVGRIKVEEERGIVESLLVREKLRTTALGNGIAFPHCRAKCTESCVGVLGIEPRGVFFDSLDGEMVQSVFLMVLPLEITETHYETLGRISALARNKSQRFQLNGYRRSEAVHRFLRDLDRK